MANSLHYGLTPGALTDLSGTDYGVYYDGDEITGMPDAQISGVTLPGLDGGHLYGQKFATRRLSVPLRIEADSAADLQEKIDSLLWKIDPRSGTGWWKFDHQADRMYYGRVVSGFTPRISGPRLARLTLSVECPQALAYAVDETTQTVTVNSNPKTFNVPASGSVAGTAAASPVWIVKNTSGGASGTLTLTNTTTGESVSASGISNNYWLRFDHDRQIIERSTDSGANWTSYMASRGSSKNIPSLAPRVVNACSLTGLTGGEITITYRARFI